MNKDQSGMAYLSQDSTEDFYNDEAETKCCQHINHISRLCQTPVEKLCVCGILMSC